MSQAMDQSFLMSSIVPLRPVCWDLTNEKYHCCAEAHSNAKQPSKNLLSYVTLVMKELCKLSRREIGTFNSMLPMR